MVMTAERPTVRCIIEKSKLRKDGKYPLYILVTWKFKRSKEATGIYLTEKDFKKGSYKTVKTLSKRLYEIDLRVSELLSEGRDFTPSDVLAVVREKSPHIIISEMCRIKKLSSRTSTGYMTTHRSLQGYFGEDYRLSSLSLPDIQGYARTLRVSPSAMAFYLKDLKSLLGYAKERGYIKENVMEKWKFKADGFRDREKPKSRSIYDIKDYVKRWRKEKGDLKEALGIWLSGFYFCGIALVDLMEVDWDSVEEKFIGDGMYYSFTIGRKKTKEVAFITTPVTDITKNLLSFLRTKPWKNRRHYSAFINRNLKKIDPTLTYYQCRHSFASLLVASRTPLNTIASLLGRSVNGLSTYIHKVTEKEVLSKASSVLTTIEEEYGVDFEMEGEVFESLIEKD